MKIPSTEKNYKNMTINRARLSSVMEFCRVKNLRNFPTHDVIKKREKELKRAITKER